MWLVLLLTIFWDLVTAVGRICGQRAHHQGPGHRAGAQDPALEGGHHYDNLNEEEQGLLEHLGSDVVLLSPQGPLSLVPAAISPSCSMCQRPTARSCWTSAL